MIQNKFTVSNTLMLISVFFTAISFIYRDILIFGMNDIFYSQWNYMYWFLQMFSSQFFHGSILHILSNAIFILYFWNVLERTIWKDRYILFFILCALFIGVVLTFLTNANTFWISWFALAVLTYYTLILWSKWNPEYTGWVTAVVINIAVWLTPGISFLWHFAGMVFWILFFITFDGRNKIKRKIKRYLL